MRTRMSAEARQAPARQCRCLSISRDALRIVLAIIGGVPTRARARHGDRRHMAEGRFSIIHFAITRAVFAIAWEAPLPMPRLAEIGQEGKHRSGTTSVGLLKQRASRPGQGCCWRFKISTTLGGRRICTTGHWVTPVCQCHIVHLSGSTRGGDRSIAARASVLVGVSKQADTWQTSRKGCVLVPVTASIFFPWVDLLQDWAGWHGG